MKKLLLLLIGVLLFSCNPKYPCTHSESGLCSDFEAAIKGIYRDIRFNEFDETLHWNVCSFCGEKTDILPHKIESRWFRSEDELCSFYYDYCTECKYIKEYPEKTFHKFETAWSYDDEYHWHEPLCDHDVKEDYASHDFHHASLLCKCGLKKPNPTFMEYDKTYIISEYDYFLEKQIYKEMTVQSVDISPVGNGDNLYTINFTVRGTDSYYDHKYRNTYFIFYISNGKTITGTVYSARITTTPYTDKISISIPNYLQVSHIECYSRSGIFLWEVQY